VATDASEPMRRETATLATAMDTELEESDPFVDVEGWRWVGGEGTCSRRLVIHYTMLSTILKL